MEIEQFQLKKQSGTAAEKAALKMLLQQKSPSLYHSCQKLRGENKTAALKILFHDKWNNIPPYTQTEIDG